MLSLSLVHSLEPVPSPLLVCSLDVVPSSQLARSVLLVPSPRVAHSGSLALSLGLARSNVLALSVEVARSVNLVPSLTLAHSTISGPSLCLVRTVNRVPSAGMARSCHVLLRLPTWLAHAVCCSVFRFGSLRTHGALSSLGSLHWYWCCPCLRLALTSWCSQRQWQDRSRPLLDPVTIADPIAGTKPSAPRAAN